jgi:hypothetical protein
VVNGLAFLVGGPFHERYSYVVGLAHCLAVALMPLRLDLVSLVRGSVVMCHGQPMNRSPRYIHGRRPAAAVAICGR